MNRNVSSLLDVLRYFAALLVVFHHLEHIYVKSWVSALASFGHDAVTFFFLLSGFVIAHTTKLKDFDVRDYAVARLSRIYSVVLPALALTAFLYVLGNWLGLRGYSIGLAEWFAILPVSLFFLNNSFGWHAELPSNAAYWSVCFEVWYYIIFACAFYIRGLKRIFCLGVVVCMAGLGALAMFPIWLLGYWFYRLHARLKISQISAALLLIGAVSGYLYVRWLNLDDKFFDAYSDWFGGADHLNGLLGFGKRFLADYLIAILMLMMLIGIFSIAVQCEKFPEKIRRIIQLCAGGSFSMYLFHMPILAFISSFSRCSVLVLVLTLFSCHFLSRWTEQNKRPYARIFRALLSSAK